MQCLGLKLLTPNLTWGGAHSGETCVLHKCVWEGTREAPNLAEHPQSLQPQELSPMSRCDLLSEVMRSDHRPLGCERQGNRSPG